MKKIHLLSSPAIWASAFALVWLVPGSAVPQVEKTARPQIHSEAQYRLLKDGKPLGGNQIRIFFAEGKSFEDHAAHVYFEPLVYLETDKRGNLDYDIDAPGKLTLYIRCETDRTVMDAALRAKMLETAQQKSLNQDIRPGSQTYRINPIRMKAAWLESLQNRVGSSPIKSQIIKTDSCTELASFPVFFSLPTVAEAQEFLSDIQHNRDALIFTYTFSGIEYDECTARKKGRYGFRK